MAAPVLKLGLMGTIPHHRLFPTFYTTRKGDEITYHQTRAVHSIGSWVYDGALCLSKYMESDHFRERYGDLQGRKVIEIGAGCGNVGIMAGCYGAEAIVTDIEPMLPLMEYNIEQNRGVLTGEVRAVTHSWGGDVSAMIPPYPDFLVLANCVYYRPSLDLLLESTCALAGPDTTVLACYELRSPEIAKLIRGTWHGMAEKRFTIEEVPPDVYHSKFSEEVEVLIVIMKKKAD